MQDRIFSGFFSNNFAGCVAGVVKVLFDIFDFSVGPNVKKSLRLKQSCRGLAHLQQGMRQKEQMKSTGNVF
jgi:hypothetical protein